MTEANQTAEMRLLYLLGGLALVCAVVFLTMPQIDLGVARLFVDDNSKFYLRKHPVTHFFNELIDKLGLILALGVIFGTFYTAIRRVSLIGLDVRQYSFLFFSLLIGPALIANGIFKSLWGRARPRQLIEFGGSKEFSPPLLISDQCPSNCSFVSGDAALAFTMIAFAIVVPVQRRLWIALAVLFGIFIGGVRVVQGAHFLSDVIYSGIFMSATIIVLKMIILDRHWGVSAWFESRPRALGLVHDGEDGEARKDALNRMNLTSAKRRSWFFFRSKPTDFSGDD